MKHFRKILTSIGVLLVAIMIAATASAQTGTYIKKAVNLRSSPSTSSSSYGLVSSGTTCNILGESSGWYHVKITSHTKNKVDLYGKTGYSLKEYIKVDGTSGGGSSGGGSESSTGEKYDDFPNNGELVVGKASFNTGYVRIRALPSANSLEIGKLNKGDMVHYYSGMIAGIKSDSLQWYKITYPAKGFVAAKYITKDDNASSTNKCDVCGGDLTYVAHENVEQGGLYNQILVGNTYVRYYHATADRVLTCKTHKSNSVFEKRVSGYMKEFDKGSFSESPIS